MKTADFLLKSSRSSSSSFVRSRKHRYLASLSTARMMTPISKEPRQFAPLGEGDDKTVDGVPELKGVVFDVDGTLW